VENNDKHLVAAICPQCGAHLDVDPKSLTLYCQYCGSKFIVKDAIDALKNANITFDESTNSETHVDKVGGFANSVKIVNETPVTEFEYLKAQEETKQKQMDLEERKRQDKISMKLLIGLICFFVIIFVLIQLHVIV